MGIYDREYYQDEHAGSFTGRTPGVPRAPMSMTVKLIIANVIVFVAILFVPSAVDPAAPTGRAFWVTALSVSEETVHKPWLWWQMLTYGFLHNPRDVLHLLFNMVGLFFFGRLLESRLGRGEFLRFYLAALLAGGVVTALHHGFLAPEQPVRVMGASGAVSAVVLLCAIYYPKLPALLFVIPMPLWALATLMVVYNVFHSIRQFGGSVGGTAYDVHLAGLAFAALYWYFRWDFGRLFALFRSRGGGRRRKRPSLRIHRGDEEELAAEADRILAKLQREGADRLTRKEQETLERYSRLVRERRRGSPG